MLPTVDIELEVPDQAIAFVETEPAPILGDETVAPVFIEQAQVVLAIFSVQGPCHDRAAGLVRT